MCSEMDDSTSSIRSSSDSEVDSLSSVGGGDVVVEGDGDNVVFAISCSRYSIAAIVTDGLRDRAPEERLVAVLEELDLRLRFCLCLH